MRLYFIIINFIFLLLLTTVSFTDPVKNRCANFDQIALQMASGQNKTPSPLSLEEIKLTLGANSQETSTTITRYTWTHKNRILIVIVSGDSISDKMLAGDDDGSMISKKMEQIYSNLQGATSIWSIKDIQRQLGAQDAKSSKLLNYSWHCDNGSLTIATNENNQIVSAKINYRVPLDSIETRIGANHPQWDIKKDSLGQSYYAWQRSFMN